MHMHTAHAIAIQWAERAPRNDYVVVITQTQKSNSFYDNHLAVMLSESCM